MLVKLYGHEDEREMKVPFPPPGRIQLACKPKGAAAGFLMGLGIPQTWPTRIFAHQLDEDGMDYYVEVKQ